MVRFSAAVSGEDDTKNGYVADRAISNSSSFVTSTSLNGSVKIALEYQLEALPQG